MHAYGHELPMALTDDAKLLAVLEGFLRRFSDDVHVIRGHRVLAYAPRPTGDAALDVI